jgi:hypothetical protein
MAAKKKKDISVAATLDRELKEIAKRAPELADSTLAASARAIAAELDTAGNSATSKSMCARALNETLGRLYDLLPAEEKKDRVDELKQRRAKRLAGRSGASG